MRYINKFIIISFFAYSLMGCKKDYLDINKNPNTVTENNVTAGLIFPQAATSVGARAASLNFRFLNNWLGYWANYDGFAIDQTETTYGITTNFGDALWQNHYDVLYDLEQVRVKALAANDQVLAGAAMILSAKLYQELVDIYGNVPFSQALQYAQYQQPAYDKGADVYAGLQKNLDLAISYMGKTANSSFATVDIVNAGDKTKWIKFANTLKLRLLIRQSEMSGFSATSEMVKIVATGGVLHAGETIAVNPGYSNSTNKQSPFYANYGLTVAAAEANPIARANKYFVDLLTTTNDSRLTRFFIGPTVIGTPYGRTNVPPLTTASRMGPGLANSATQNQWIMPAFESMFLEAEAISRGWMTGNAQSSYEAAVKESFSWLGVPDATNAATKYLANTDIANFTNAGTTATAKAKFIAYQKYIALCGIDPVEAWSDLRRLNMIPNNGYISLNPGKLSPTIPVRLLYPQSEYSYNAANVNTQGTINQFSSKIFWQP